MNLICAPSNYAFAGNEDILEIILYGRADRQTRGSTGAAIKDEILREKLSPAKRAWDFLSVALSVTAADLAGHRENSSDGWTREFDLTISVSEPDFWNSQRVTLENLLSFLTTDRWRLRFVPGGSISTPDQTDTYPMQDCVALLSGGLDSFIGCIDLVTEGKQPFVVSQIVRGDADNQRAFAREIGNLRHLQINHNTDVPEPENPPSQRSRSLIFLAYAVLAASMLQRYHAGENITAYVCENGFISINPPLTAARIGSLSTRTTHPVFLNLIQQILDAADLRVTFQNPYRLKTKGEMLRECANRQLLLAHACETTSCGRFKQYGYKHCGRCVPCLVRRAAFLAANIPDTTEYVYKNLGRNDDDHAGFDDVRAMAMALAEVETEGLSLWLGSSLSTAIVPETSELEATVGRGLAEVGALLNSYGVT